MEYFIVAQQCKKEKWTGGNDIVRLKMLNTGMETGYPLTLDQ